MSVALVTVAHGDTYRAFLPEWVQAATRLETPPDWYGVITDEITPEVLDAVEDMPCPGVVVQATTTFTHHPQFLINEVIEGCDTDWICKMDVDDLILPHALNDLPEDADVVMFGITVQRGDYQQHLLSPQCGWQAVLHNPGNLVFSGSPFRKWLWRDNQFRDMMYEDWTFWLGCAKQQARFHASTRPDYIYRLAGHNVSNRIDDAYWRGIVEGLR